MPRILNKEIVALNVNEIFVFGSNKRGQHGGGAAAIARLRFGAESGVGEGLTGQCYALPTLDENLQMCTLSDIHLSILKLAKTASDNPLRTFYLTRIGQGIAGFTETEIRGVIGRVKLPSNLIPWWKWEGQGSAGERFHALADELEKAFHQEIKNNQDLRGRLLGSADLDFPVFRQLVKAEGLLTSLTSDDSYSWDLLNCVPWYISIVPGMDGQPLSEVCMVDLQKLLAGHDCR